MLLGECHSFHSRLTRHNLRGELSLALLPARARPNIHLWQYSAKKNSLRIKIIGSTLRPISASRVMVKQ